MASAWFACLLGVAAAVVARSASASDASPSQPGRAMPVQPEALPEREVLNQDPAAAGLLLFDLLEQAELAEKKGDSRAAVRYYEAVARAVPERATAFSKLCALYQSLGEREAAIAACYRATGLPGTTVADQLRYAELLLAKPAGQEFSEAELNELRATFEHVRAAGVQSPELQVLECQLAVVREELDGMRACVERLRVTLPQNSPVTLTYAMSLALFERDFALARALLAQAPQSGMSRESIALMEKELAARTAQLSADSSLGAGATSSWAAVFGGAFALTVLAAITSRAWRRRPKTA